MQIGAICINYFELATVFKGILHSTGTLIGSYPSLVLCQQKEKQFLIFHHEIPVYWRTVRAETTQLIRTDGPISRRVTRKKCHVAFTVLCLGNCYSHFILSGRGGGSGGSD